MSNDSSQDNSFRTEELAKAEIAAIKLLSKEQLQKYNKVLFYFLEKAGSCGENKVIQTSLSNNALELNDALPKLQNAFLPESVEQLHLAKVILEKAVPLARDVNLGILLSKNLNEIDAFFKRFEPYLRKNYPQCFELSESGLANSKDNEDSRKLMERILNPYANPSDQKEFKKLIKNITNYPQTGKKAVETPEIWAQIAQNLDKSPAHTEYDTAVSELLIGTVARIRENERLMAKQIQQAQQNAELSYSEKKSKAERRKEINAKLNAIAGSIIDSYCSGGA